MRFRRATLVALACVTIAPATAHAAEPSMTVEIVPSFTFELAEGSGTYLAGGLCQAVATPAPGSAQIPVAVQVACSFNGTSRSATAPGGHVATTVVVAAKPPIIACRSGSAIFLDAEDGANRLIEVTYPEFCFVHPV
jgi:hypothetical protein